MEVFVSEVVKKVREEKTNGQAGRWKQEGVYSSHSGVCCVDDECFIGDSLLSVAVSPSEVRDRLQNVEIIGQPFDNGTKDTDLFFVSR